MLVIDQSECIEDRPVPGPFPEFPMTKREKPWERGCSLPFFSLNWNLFLYGFSVSSLSLILVSPFSTISAAVVSSTYFHKSVLVVSISSIINTNNQGLNFVHWGTPVCTFFHSDLQSGDNFTLCLRHFRKLTIQLAILGWIFIYFSFRTNIL